MQAEARRRTYAQRTATVAGGGAGFIILTVPLPSPPFLDESAAPATFRKVTIQVAARVGTVPANWLLVPTVQFQPMRGGPSASFALPAASTSGLTVLHDWLAVPGATLQVVATNLAAGADTITISAGGMVAPNWIDVDQV